MHHNDIKMQIDRIIHHPLMGSTCRLAQFLNYVVDETLAGRSSRIKGYSIAVSVLGKDHTFDPQTDPIVRITAGRLREKLKLYYATCGQNDPIHVEVPVGTYVPKFSSNTSNITKTHSDNIATLHGNGKVYGDEKQSVKPILIAVPKFSCIGSTLFRKTFCNGLREEIILNINRYRHISVQSEALLHSAINVSMPNADFMIECNVFYDDTKTRLYAKLIHPNTGTCVSVERYDLDITTADMIDVQEKMADTIVSQFKQNLLLSSENLIANHNQIEFCDHKTLTFNQM